MISASTMPKILAHGYKSLISYIKTASKINPFFAQSHESLFHFTPIRRFSEINASVISSDASFTNKISKQLGKDKKFMPSPMSFEEYVKNNLCSFNEYRKKIEGGYKEYNPQGLPSLDEIKKCYERYCYSKYNGYKNSLFTCSPFIV